MYHRHIDKPCMSCRHYMVPSSLLEEIQLRYSFILNHLRLDYAWVLIRPYTAIGLRLGLHGTAASIDIPITMKTVQLSRCSIMY